MANPTVTYTTFPAGTTADGTQVSQNCTDIINALTDGTKSLTINTLSATNSGAGLAGTFNHTGAVNGSTTGAIQIGDPNTIANGTGIYMRTSGEGSFSTGGSTGNFAWYNNGSKWMALSSAGVLNLSQLTASQAVFTDGSSNLVSKAVTGTGSVVLATAPTVTGAWILSDAGTIGNASDFTKALGFSLSGATTSTKSTFSFAQTANRTITFQDATDTVVMLATTDTLTNKTISTGGTNKIGSTTISGATGTSSVVFSAAPTITSTWVLSDAGTIGNASDFTKAIAFSLSGATTAKTMTITSSHTNNRTLTLPDATDTLTGKATTDTLTNKTISTGGTNLIGSTTISGTTGSGNVVFSASPTFSGTTTFPGSTSVDGSGNIAVGADVSIAHSTDASTGTINALTSTNHGFIILTASSTLTLNGIANGSDGRILFISNETGQTMTVNNLSASASAANQIRCPAGATYSVRSNGSMLVIYDGLNGVWNVVAG